MKIGNIEIDDNAIVKEKLPKQKPMTPEQAEWYRKNFNGMANKKEKESTNDKIRRFVNE